MDHNIGEIIRSRRIELGMTLQQVGDSIGVTKSTISRWERGFTESINKAELVAVAKVLYVDPTFLLSSETAPQPIEPEIIILRKKLITKIENIEFLDDLKQIDTFIRAFIK